MIAFLKGKLIQKEPSHVVIDVNGVGYHVNISLQTFSAIKDQEAISLFTHLSIREDAHVLFGFSTEAEKRLFLHLISVNGVGPSTAIVMLSFMEVEELKAAIAREDIATLQRVKGIGGKTAQRLIVELKDKLKKEVTEESGSSPLGLHNTIKQQALSALVTLGIPRPAAEKSVDAILKKSGNNLTLEDLVKQALKNA
ncbi:Holliday junction branch migration protein RuvA [Chryseotalea sanaruensis]|uniref:Holliday junction branch migration complex subunit RuvA n=1 Tax=Chryseotalea sanaruensis TaxID=2482724 RepID=A0A401UFE8_9BACT|nr:Holliday junction branch migration protein RuvA [Chryseotalea sanaruensis]GCC53613.1 Holliday junction branch migration protein RuvA [Chryseotalea sanaruensis]